MAFENYLQMMNTDYNTFRESTREAAEKQTKTELLLNAVAEAESIEVTEEELEAEMQTMAELYGMKLEDVKAALGDAESIKEELRHRKTVTFLKDNAVASKPKAKRASKPRTKKAAPAEETAAPVEEAPKAEESAE
jgi:trigger factor